MLLQRRVFPGSLILGLSIGLAMHANAVEVSRSYLVESISLPANNIEARSDAIDLDGDGSADNQFGSLLATLHSQGLDFQGPMDTAIAAGSLVHVIRVQSADALFANDAAAQADWCVAVPTPTPPQFDGTDTPACDNNYTLGTFLAALTAGGFTAPSPVTTVDPAEVTLQMAFGPYVNALTQQSARLSFQLDQSGHMQEQLNGSINHADIPTKVDPAFAQWFNWIIQNDPGNAAAVKGLFDTGCSPGDGFANDNMIEICEVTGSGFMQSLLAPDVQTRDSLGNYVDANSFGARFTAVVSPDRIYAGGFEP